MDNIIEKTMNKDQNEILEALKLILSDKTISLDFKEISDILNNLSPSLTQKVIEMLILSFYLGIENARKPEDIVSA